MSKRVTQDGINDLPDSVLLYILSFLDTEEVVRTSVLSKRWENIWKSVPALSFVCHDSDGDGIAKFVARVNIALSYFQQASIEKFKIDALKCLPTSDIDNWALFAVNKKVADLSLRSPYHDLPKFICCNSYLKNLSLLGGTLSRASCISWPSLKSLSLEFTHLGSDTLRKVLSGCPMLEFLKLIGCWGLNSLGNESKSLREAVIVTKDADLIDITVLNISAPNLRFLHISGGVFCDQFQGVNVPSLVRAKLNCSHPVLWNIGCFKSHYDNFMGFLGSISHIKELELGGSFIQCLSNVMFVPEARALTLQFSCLTSLKVSLSSSELNVPGLIILLKCSPNLEKFVVYSRKDSKTVNHFSGLAEEYWTEERRESFPLPHLKTVKFLEFFDLEDVDKYLRKLVQFLLKNAGHLGRIIICGEEYELILKPLKYS